jgi:hypothetical protein
MNILRSGHSPGHQFTDSVEPARGRRYPPGAVRFRSKQVHQSGDTGPVGRAERKSPVSMSANRKKTPVERVRGGPAGVVILIFCVGLALEATLPWAMIWLSDLFVFDTPAWSRWLVFGAPVVLSVLALVLYQALGTGSRQLRPASITTEPRR